MADFPLPLTQIDSSTFKEGIVDKTVRSETDGGYELTRPRSTRAPRRTFEGTFTHVTEAGRAGIAAFVASKYVSALSFTFLHPVTSETLTVRFDGEPKYVYKGIGGTHRWDITFSLKQV